MNKSSRIFYDHNVDFSRFNYTPEMIKLFQEKAYEIQKYFSLPITENNFNEVLNIWYYYVSRIPLPCVPIQERFILRSRHSKPNEVFEDEGDISYNSKCPKRINPGRFNQSQEAIFYGVLPSDKQSQYVSAATIESYKELISDGNADDVIYYHLCKFNVKQVFPVVNLCFEPRVVNIHPGLRHYIASQITNIRANLPMESAEAIIRFWRYVSEISSTRKLCDQHYMISTALFCAIRKYYDAISDEPVAGIIYPSPMVYGDAVNIAMIPSAVDKYLAADDCFIFKYIRALKDNKQFDTDICSKPTKVTNGKLNITEVVWGRELGNFGY